MDIQKLDQTYIAGTYARFPVTIVKGKGSLVWDENGKEYIDLSTGIAVDIFGVADEQWMAAVTKQLGTLQHISNLYYTEPCAKLAQLLCEKTGMKKVFFGNSGAEANECAIKAARKWSEDKKGKEYSTIITLKNSFHGRTITTLAATGQDVFHHDFLPLTEGFVYAEPNDLADLARLIAENKCAAVMMEVVQGEGGVMPLDEAYVKGAAKLCQETICCSSATRCRSATGAAACSTAIWPTACSRTLSRRPRGSRAVCRWARRCWARRCRTC